MQRSPVLLVLACAIAPCALGCATPEVLERVGRVAETPDLAGVQARAQAPLVVIGETVFLPPCACLDQPCTRARELGAQADRRESGSAADARASGAATDGRAAGSATDERSGGAGTDRRERGSATDAQRQGGAAKDDRQGGNAVDERQTGNAADVRTLANRADERDQRASSDARLVGGAVSRVMCVRTGRGAFQVIAEPNQTIRYLESGALREAADRVVRY